MKSKMREMAVVSALCDRRNIPYLILGLALLVDGIAAESLAQNVVGGAAAAGGGVSVGGAAAAGGGVRLGAFVAAGGAPVFGNAVQACSRTLGYLQGGFGTLVAAGAGMGAIVSAALGGFKAAWALFVVSVGCFIIRTYLTLFMTGC